MCIAVYGLFPHLLETVHHYAFLLCAIYLHTQLEMLNGLKQQVCIFYDNLIF